jgi:hypothetical protein
MAEGVVSEDNVILINSKKNVNTNFVVILAAIFT